MPAAVLNSPPCLQNSKPLLQQHPFPPGPQITHRALSSPLALRGARLVLLLLKQLSSEVETEAEVILTLLINLIIGGTDAGEPRPGWMRDGDNARVRLPSILHSGTPAYCYQRSSIRIYMCRLCSNAEFMRSVRQRYNALATDGDTSSTPSARVFTLLISALKRLVTLCPVLLGISA
jgi:hypothetical protein